MNRSAMILQQLETSLSAAPESLSRRFGVSTKTIAAEVAALNAALGSSGYVRLHQGKYRLRVR